MGDRKHNAQSREGSPYWIMSKRLPNSNTFTIDGQPDEPSTHKLEIGYCCMLELSMAVCTDNQQVIGMMADVWVKMVYLKVRFAIPFFESERTKLTLPIV